MAQAQNFETDFWKDANLRKSWDEIVPGEPRKTQPYLLTQEAIALYCKAVGETNPLYLDEKAAKAGAWDDAKKAAAAVGGACGACHTPYRERLEDGSFRFKAGS